ncbi:related to translocation protein sec62 [Ustilago trichophora]|uniref:Translocation protein SEC62 n=1 Tax=Ustilago trichophora TaxID=86804 RepID=A0A5C3E4J6_9BASI|nr:related to translocation protein sec62 [Ustilago trichophora]
MTKARRRNLRAPSTSSPIAAKHQRRSSHADEQTADSPKAVRCVEAALSGVPLDSDAATNGQINLNSFIDMTSHSADFIPSLASSAPRKSSSSSCCPADDHDDTLMTHISQEQQSSAPLPARNVVNFLRNKSGIKTRVGALNGKRVDYFKGSAAVKALLSPAYAKLKDVPKVTTKEEAEECLHNIIPFAFFLRVDRGPSTGGKDSPKVVEINQQQMFKSELHYVWLYEGSQLGLKLAGLGMVVVMLAGVMFPLWPPTMRLGVWYLSVGALGLIGLFFAIAIVRLIFWLITLVVAKPGIWIFPNLFEDVGFVDSFIPLWGWDVPPAPKKSKKSAAGSGGGEAKKRSVGGAGAGAGARQQALSNLGGAAPTGPPSPPKPPQQAAQSTPANSNAAQNGGAPGQSSGSGGPGASDSLDDIN